jgi:predicted nuclease with TOPRIM domain
LVRDVQVRLQEVTDQIQAIDEQLMPLKAKYEREKGRVEEIRQLQSKLEETKIKMQIAQRNRDFGAWMWLVEGGGGRCDWWMGGVLVMELFLEVWSLVVHVVSGAITIHLHPITCSADKVADLQYYAIPGIEEKIRVLEQQEKARAQAMDVDEDGPRMLTEVVGPEQVRAW